MAAKMCKCEVCGADIASSAKRCPNCGAKVKKPLNIKMLGIVLAIVLVLFGGKMVLDGMNASTIKVNGAEYTAKELKKIDNEYGILNNPCTVIMTVKGVDQQFNQITSKDGVQVSWWMQSISSSNLEIAKSLKSGDKIEVNGIIDFVGPWQVVVKDIASIKIIK